MGLINNDNFIASNGVQKIGTYLSFSQETLYLRKNPSPPPVSPPPPVPIKQTYNVYGNYRIFWDKEAKDAGKTYIELRTITAMITEDDLGSNLYQILYAELKKSYPNCTDDLTLF
jgi:hypothetical protein